MYKKTLLPVILILFFLFTGCQREKNQNVTITMVSGSVGKELEVLEDQISIFQKDNPHIQVILVESPESQNRKYDQYLYWLKNKNSGVDVYILDIVWISEFGEAGWLLPLNSYIKKENIDMEDFLESTVKASIWEDKILSLPWFTDAGVLYYRQDLLEKYNFNVPRTWTDLKKTAQEIVEKEKVHKPNMVGFVFQADRYEGLVTNYLEYIRGNGTDILDNSGEVIIDREKAVEALKTFVEMLEISSPGAIAFQEEDARNYFQSGNSVFMRNWPYAWTLLNGENSEVRNKFSIAPLPVGEYGETGAATLGGWQLAISAHTEHPEEAFRLISFLTSTEQQTYKAIKAGQNPTRKSCYNDENVIKINPAMKSLFDIVLEASARPIHPRYSEISKIIQEEIHSTLKGEQSPEIATNKIIDKIKKTVGEEEN